MELYKNINVRYSIIGELLGNTNMDCGIYAAIIPPAKQDRRLVFSSVMKLGEYEGVIFSFITNQIILQSNSMFTENFGLPRKSIIPREIKKIRGIIVLWSNAPGEIYLSEDTLNAAGNNWVMLLGNV